MIDREPRHYPRGRVRPSVHRARDISGPVEKAVCYLCGCRFEGVDVKFVLDHVLGCERHAAGVPSSQDSS